MTRLLCITLVALAACATPERHDAFKQVMARQIGKKADDPDFYPVFYKLRGGASKQLPNGNEEAEYKTGRNERCSLFFEIHPVSHQVVRWRFDGSDKDCIVGTPYN